MFVTWLNNLSHFFPLSSFPQMLNTLEVGSIHCYICVYVHIVCVCVYTLFEKRSYKEGEEKQKELFCLLVYSPD